MPEEKTLTKGEQTRVAVIEAAYALFLQNGFHGTSMRQIAERSGLALGGIYNHFSSKEEIFAEVLDAYHPYRKVLPAIEATEGETVDAFVMDGARKMRAAMAGEETRLLPLVFIELVEFQGRHFAKLAENLLPPLMMFTQRFSQRRGRLRPLPLPLVIRSFIGIFVASILTDMVAKHIPAMNNTDYDWFGGMMDIYLHGILEAEA